MKIKSKKIAGTSPALSENDYTGNYHSDMYGTMTISAIENKLRLDFEHSPALSATLEHWHYDTWEIIWDRVHAWFGFGTLQFLLNNKLEITGMKLDVPNNDIFFHELEIYKAD